MADIVAGSLALDGKEDLELLCRVTSLSLLLGNYLILPPTMCEGNEGSKPSPRALAPIGWDLQTLSVLGCLSVPCQVQILLLCFLCIQIYVGRCS